MSWHLSIPLHLSLVLTFDLVHIFLLTLIFEIGNITNTLLLFNDNLASSINFFNACVFQSALNWLDYVSTIFISYLHQTVEIGNLESFGLPQTGILFVLLRNISILIVSAEHISYLNSFFCGGGGGASFMGFLLKDVISSPFDLVWSLVDININFIFCIWVHSTEVHSLYSILWVFILCWVDTLSSTFLQVTSHIPYLGGMYIGFFDFCVCMSTFCMTQLPDLCLYVFFFNTIWKGASPWVGGIV